MFFGFSGTPSQKKNIRKNNTTTDVFGDELHRYSIADGIRDKNVLGFDPYQVLTYRDCDLRHAAALEKAKAATPAEAFANAKKREVFNRYMNDVPMTGYTDSAGVYQTGIEDHMPSTQYSPAEHRNAVIQDITHNWINLYAKAVNSTPSLPPAVSRKPSLTTV